MIPSLNRLIIGAVLLALAAPLEAATRSRYLMGTLCEITSDAQDSAVSAAFSEIARWEKILSRHDARSELSRVNAQAGLAPVEVSADFWSALQEALRASKASSGAFDPTIKGRVIGWAKIQLDPARRTVLFTQPGMSLDFGGIGKGIALDSAAALLRGRGGSKALINFGGQVYALGSWEVQVPGRGPIRVINGSVSTSGNSEQPGHIIDPSTGRPILKAPSVSVLAPSATLADAWGTAFFVNPELPENLCRGCRVYKRKVQ